MNKDLSIDEILKIIRNITDIVYSIKLKVKRNKVDLVREFLLSMQEYHNIDKNNVVFNEYY